MKSLRSKLLLAVSLILVVTQGISILWVWHESEELIELYVTQIVAGGDVHLEDIEEDIQEEFWETMTALFVPAMVTIALAILLIFIAISYLTRPLRILVQKIESKNPYNLSPLQTGSRTPEVLVVEKSINQLLHRLELGLENERRFTADVAHELRTPLAGLRLNLELMDDTPFNNTDKQQAQTQTQPQALISRIDQMMVSIEQLLQLARAGQKLIKGEAQRFDFVKEVIIPMQMEWEEGISPTCALRWEIPTQLEMVGDSGLLYLLLRNLLENVRLYASEGEYAVVRLSQQAGWVALDVIDTGAGVGEAQITRMTQRFTRLDQSQKGHGLGLNIVSRIVLAHGGEIHIQNRQDATGLHVQVRLPCG